MVSYAGNKVQKTQHILLVAKQYQFHVLLLLLHTEK